MVDLSAEIELKKPANLENKDLAQMTEPEFNTKKCSLCNNYYDLDCFLSIRRAPGKVFYGNVCARCRGHDPDSLFHHKPIDKLQFHHDFLTPYQDDDEGGSGGWDPEDRARAITAVMTIDSKKRDSASKKQKHKTQRRQHEHKRKQEKIANEKMKSLEQSGISPVQSEDKLFNSRATTVSVEKSRQKFSLGKTQKPLVNYTLNKKTEPQDKKIEKPTKHKAEKQPKANTRQSQESEAKTQAEKVESSKAHLENNVNVTNEALLQKFITNEHMSNSYQRLGQTFEFLAPFTREGTNVRNKFTGGSPDRLNQLFNKRMTIEKRQQKDAEIKEEVNNSNVKELYNRARDIFKK